MSYDPSEESAGGAFYRDERDRLRAQLKRNELRTIESNAVLNGQIEKLQRQLTELGAALQVIQEVANSALSTPPPALAEHDAERPDLIYDWNAGAFNATKRTPTAAEKQQILDAVFAPLDDTARAEDDTAIKAICAGHGIEADGLPGDFKPARICVEELSAKLDEATAEVERLRSIVNAGKGTSGIALLSLHNTELRAEVERLKALCIGHEERYQLSLDNSNAEYNKHVSQIDQLRAYLASAENDRDEFERELIEQAKRLAAVTAERDGFKEQVVMRGTRIDDLERRMKAADDMRGRALLACGTMQNERDDANAHRTDLHDALEKCADRLEDCIQYIQNRGAFKPTQQTTDSGLTILALARETLARQTPSPTPAARP